MTTSVKSLKSDHVGAIGAYLLAAELLHLEIDQRLHSILTEEKTLELLQSLDDQCSVYLNSLTEDGGFEQAAVEYCNHFILPESKSVPRAAGWMDMEQTMLVDKVVSQFIKEWNIELPATYSQLAFDHISLILYVSSVIRQQDPEQAYEFDSLTLHPWITKLANSLTSSNVAIYRALAQLLENLGNSKS